MLCVVGLLVAGVWCGTRGTCIGLADAGCTKHTAIYGGERAGLLEGHESAFSTRKGAAFERAFLLAVPSAAATSAAASATSSA